jgi:hypothetical protein
MTREQLIEIARLCVRQAYLTSTKDVAAVLWRMAQEYFEKAANLDALAAQARNAQRDMVKSPCL